ncbi:MAG: hypothetical protein Q9M40_14705 [Sulfurimonas sp.]|nr:hypothetical protein [Sulfurimonas sp.]
MYNKYDAGFKLSNIKIVSKKKKDYEMLHFRGKDSYTTGAKYLEGDVCFEYAEKSLKVKDFISKKNSKKPKDNFTAYNYFMINHHEIGAGKFLSQKL